MKFEELRREHIVFSYQMSPAVGIRGERGGFSVTLYGNGNLRCCDYLFGEEMDTMHIFKLTKEETKAIYDCIESSKERLRKLPNELNNGSTGGDLNEFVFLDYAKVKAYNIQPKTAQMMKQKSFSYCRQYWKNMKCEDMILKTFREICQVLRRHKIKLTLKECRMRQDYRLKVTFQE